MNMKPKKADFIITPVHLVEERESEGWVLLTDEEAEGLGAEVNDQWTLVGRRVYLNASGRPPLDTPESRDAAEFWALTMRELTGADYSYINYLMGKKK